MRRYLCRIWRKFATFPPFLTSNRSWGKKAAKDKIRTVLKKHFFIFEKFLYIENTWALGRQTKNQRQRNISLASGK
jgi:hypothetical protein